MIDCMSCLIQLANGLSSGGTHGDDRGITHATLRWLGRTVVVCTLQHEDSNDGNRVWFICGSTVRA